MIPYASNTGTRKNLKAIKDAGWRLLLTPGNHTERGIPFAIDNGAWSCYQSKKPFDESAFSTLVESSGAAADFVIVPDIVAGGCESLRFSLSWMPRLCHLRQLLLPVQDGMDPLDVAAVLRSHSNLGLFLGGTTDWKLRTMREWGIMAGALDRWYHVGRVNTRRRIRLCAESGATSFDGTSVSMYSITLPLLDSARKQPNLFSVRHPWNRWNTCSRCRFRPRFPGASKCLPCLVGHREYLQIRRGTKRWKRGGKGRVPVECALPQTCPVSGG